MMVTHDAWRTGEMQLTTTIQPNDYAVPVHSVRFGDVELLQFTVSGPLAFAFESSRQTLSKLHHAWA